MINPQAILAIAPIPVFGWLFITYSIGKIIGDKGEGFFDSNYYRASFKEAMLIGIFVQILFLVIFGIAATLIELFKWGMNNLYI